METGGRRVLLFAIVGAAACGLLGDPPPVELSVRESLLGAGMIVQIENTSSEPLTRIELQFTAPSGEQRSYTADRLDAYGTLEVGWKKLGGWEIRPGTAVSLRCEGFPRAVRTKVPAAEPAPDR